MTAFGRTLRVGALLALRSGLIWKSVVNSACWRTPWTEISGNPLLAELLVPSVFEIRAVSVFDSALDSFIRAQRLSVPKRYLAGPHLRLDGRIRFLGDQGLIHNTVALHDIRQRRNNLAHDEETEIGWDQFRSDAQEIERTLQRLGLGGEAGVVQRFREIAYRLEHSAHRKFYLGPTGMVAAATVEALTDLVVEDAIARTLFGAETERPSILARLGF